MTLRLLRARSRPRAAPSKHPRHPLRDRRAGAERAAAVHHHELPHAFAEELPIQTRDPRENRPHAVRSARRPPLLARPPSRPPRPPKKTFKKNLISRARRSRRRHRFRIMYSNERYATPVANADPSVTPHMKWSKSVHPPPRPPPRPPPLPPSNRAFSATAFYSARSDDVGAESKGVRGGVERHRGVSGSKARGDGRRENPQGTAFTKRTGSHAVGTGVR